MTERIRLLGFLFLPVTLALVLVAPSSVLAQGATAIPEEARVAPLDQLVPASPRVTVGELENGLRYFIRENQDPENRAELRLVVNVGSIVEDEDQLGLAHFLEHMAFNGTEHFEKQELVEFMESIGMRLGPGVNASTSFDETIYTLEIPTDDPQNLLTAFQILEDWAHGLTLEPEEIDRERGVVIEEWRLRQGAAARLREREYPVLFNGSRYPERIPIGTVESLETFEHDALRRFYRDWYRPDLMAVVAVGDFSTENIGNLLRQHFAGIPTPPNARDRTVYTLPDHAETLFSIATDPERTGSSVAVYHKLSGARDWTIGGYRQRIVERLYNSLLNGRFSEIAREPNPPFLRASSAKGQLLRSSSVHVLTASVPEDGVERGLEVLLTEAERVARFGFTDSELEREKLSILSGIERSYANRENRSSSAFASEYIRAFLDGESIPGIEYEFELHQRFVPEITIEEVNRVGQAWIDDGNRVILIAGPEKEGLTLPSEAALTAVLDSVDEREIAPYVDNVFDQPLLAELPVPSPIVSTRTLEGDITEWALANGIRVVLKPTDFREDQVTFRGFSPGGTSLASEEDYIAARTALTLIADGGVGEFSAVDLDKALAGKLAGARPFISTYEEGVSGAASPSDLETMFQLLYLRFVAPRADETVFEVWKSRTRESLANRDASPTRAFGDAYNRLLTQDHPRQRPFSLEMLDQTDLDRSLAFYRDRFSDASDYTFVFVGTIDLETMRPLVERYLGGLPTTGRQETWRDIGIRPPTGVVEETVYRGIEPQSRTGMAFTGPFDYADQAERTGIRAMAMTVQTRLRDVLREELGGTYSVGVNAGTSWRPEERYTLTVNFGSDPERTDELVETLFEGIEELKAVGPTEEEVRNTREALLRSFETDFERNGTWLSQLVSDYQRGVDPGASIRSYAASVEALTPETIREDVVRYFDLENYVRVTLMPEP